MDMMKHQSNTAIDSLKAVSPIQESQQIKEAQAEYSRDRFQSSTVKAVDNVPHHTKPKGLFSTFEVII